MPADIAYLQSSQQLLSELPEPFQYFGLWFLTCFILQSWFAWKLMGLATRAGV